MKKLALVLLVSAPLFAQVPQIPTLQVCNGTTAGGSGTVQILSRASGALTGKVTVSIDMGCNVNGTGYPSGAFSLTNISFTDSSTSSVTATTVEQYTTTGTATPTLYANGRCNAVGVTGGQVPCHWWLTIADNRKPPSPTTPPGTPDVVGFLVVDKLGKRITYGTGPLVTGDINILPTSN
jgi:hypothetical protein